jgi:hypothetical protein
MFTVSKSKAVPRTEAVAMGLRTVKSVPPPAGGVMFARILPVRRLRSTLSFLSRLRIPSMLRRVRGRTMIVEFPIDRTAVLLKPVDKTAAAGMRSPSRAGRQFREPDNNSSTVPVFSRIYTSGVWANRETRVPKNKVMIRIRFIIFSYIFSTTTGLVRR